jgi:hypothetical protein
MPCEAKNDGTPLLAHCGQWMQPARCRDQGLMPTPHWVSLPELLYAQVVQAYRRRRLVGVKYRGVVSTMERVQQVLSACGRKRNTACVERLNLDIRQRVAAGGVGSVHPVRARTAYASSWGCTKGTTMSAYPTPACGSRCRFLRPPMVAARPRGAAVYAGDSRGID